MNREYIFYVVLISCLISINNTIYARSFGQLRTIQSDGLASTASITGIVKPTGTSNSQYSNTIITFEDTEKLDIELSIDIAEEDIGFNSSIYLLIKFDDNWFYCNSGGQCNKTSPNQSISDITAYKLKELEAKEYLPIVSSKLLGAGEYLVYIAYLNRQNKLVYNAEPLSFIIFSSENSNLHQFRSSHSMTAYFKSAFSNTLATNSSSIGSQFSGASDTSTPADTSSSVSGTNVQEKGVEEADKIKTNGKQLFVLKKCQGSSDNCLGVYNISESPATNTFISEYKFSTAKDYSIDNIYLTELENNDTDQSIVIRVSKDNSWSWYSWFYPITWGDSKTKIEFIDVTQSSNMKSLHHIELEGRLVSSRRIGNMLYLVTRSTPQIEGYYDWYPSEPTSSITQQDIDNNQKLLDGFDINDHIPNITVNEQAAAPLHQISDCYLPPHTSKKLADRSIISVTAIPIDNISAYKSSCIVGSTDTFYASNNAIYLATSRAYASELSNTSGFPFSINYDYKTEIHKLSMTDKKLEYKGSGSVKGSLGGDLDKKPFRMGEYNNQLRIATSIPSTWNETTNSWNNDNSSSLYILAENEQNNALEVISKLSNLGKPGETLYASRFIGARGYLVTFQRTDPLYVLDLSDGYNPKVIGELEVEGFSEYLHPIGDSLLLGIGKQTKTEIDEYGNERVYQQGLKLSLFDVSSSESIREIQSMEIGKQPTSSSLLDDHHSFSFLEGDGNRPTRFALPVNLFNSESDAIYFDPNKASSYWDWTHAGLYIFDLDTSNPEFSLNSKLITAEAIPLYYYRGEVDGRSILQGNTVHYFTNNQLFSKALSN